MKRTLSILFSVVFSIFILIIGAGINVVRCNHSGKYKMTLTVVEFDNDFSCTPGHGCMQKEFFKFAPDVIPDFLSVDVPDLNATEFAVFEIPYFDNIFSEHYAYCPQCSVTSPPIEIYKKIEVFRI